MGEPELALLREVYADWEQGNFRRTDYFDPEYELVYARDFLDEGEFHGPEEASRGWRRWLEEWEWWRVIPLEYIEAGDRIGVKVLVEGVSKSTGMTLTQESGNLFEFRDGRPCRITLYTRSETLLEDLAS